jgi:hypothetical protein
MKISFDDFAMVLVLAVGIYCLFLAWKFKKLGQRPEASTLSILLGTCLLFVAISGVFMQSGILNHEWHHRLSVVQLIICGVALGVYVVMFILGHFKLLKRPEKLSDEDRLP